MDINQVVIAVVPIIVVIVVFVLDKVDKTTFSRKSRLREEYKFIRDFVLGLKPDMHPYLLEKGYFAVAGNDKLTAPEIKYVLSLKSPSRAFKIYTKVKSYVEFVETPQEGQKNINFRKRYQTFKKRLFFKIIFFTFYLICAEIVLLPLFLFTKLSGKDWKLVLVIILFDLFSFGIFAFISLLKYRRLCDSEELVKIQ